MKYRLYILHKIHNEAVTLFVAVHHNKLVPDVMDVVEPTEDLIVDRLIEVVFHIEGCRSNSYAETIDEDG